MSMSVKLRSQQQLLWTAQTHGRVRPDDSSCYSEEYLVEWKWDLDTHTDSIMMESQITTSMQQVRHIRDSRSAGAWEVKLTVVDNNGFEDSTKSMVYVNHIGV